MKLFLFTVVLFIVVVENVTFKFVVTNSTLPVALHHHAAVYDGVDSIFLLGGYSGDGAYLDSVIKYSLADESVQVVGTFLPLASGVSLLHEGNIFYVGGYDGRNSSAAVYRYSISTDNYSLVHQLPVPISGMSSAWDPSSQSVYVFGGFGTDALVFEYNPRANSLEQVSRLPYFIQSAAAVWVTNGLTYVLGGRNEYGRDSDLIFEYDPNTKIVTRVPRFLPEYLTNGCAVLATTNYVYTLGGRAFMRFNPTNYELERVTLDGWPNWLEGMACIHVPKSGRVYVFGGSFQRYSPPSLTNQIAYIDLM